MTQNWYETPASELGMTAKQLVRQRLWKLGELYMQGANIKDTAMLRAFASAAN